MTARCQLQQSFGRAARRCCRWCRMHPHRDAARTKRREGAAAAAPACLLQQPLQLAPRISEAPRVSNVAEVNHARARSNVTHTALRTNLVNGSHAPRVLRSSRREVRCRSCSIRVAASGEGGASGAHLRLALLRGGGRPSQLFGRGVLAGELLLVPEHCTCKPGCMQPHFGIDSSASILIARVIHSPMIANEGAYCLHFKLLDRKLPLLQHDLVHAAAHLRV